MKNTFALIVFYITLTGCSSSVTGVKLDNSLFAAGILQKLTGTQEILQGITINDRYLPQNKEVVRTFLSETLVSFGIEPRENNYGSGINVYGELPAVFDTDETVVLGAHYDTVKGVPGASDNGTGITVVLMILRELVQIGNRQKNILVVFFDEEELGLIGANHFAEFLLDSDMDINSVHTIDMIGWDEDGDGAIEIEMPYDGAFELYLLAVDQSGLNVNLYETDVTETDHHAFREAGFKAVGLSEEYFNGDTTPFYHKKSDNFSTVDMRYLLNSAKIVTKAFQILLTKKE